MSDRADPVINKNIGSTLYYYNVEPSYFDDMTFYEAISMRAYLAKENSIRLYKMQENCFGDGSLYSELESWLNDVYRAIEFNEQLLKERKHEKVKRK